MKSFLVRHKKLLALIAVTIGSSTAILDGTVVNLALPKIADEFGAGLSQQQWTADAYLLSLSALILVGGSLGDIYGRKKIYLIGTVGFGLSSLACALAPTVEALIVLRFVQGVFGALMVPGALSIITTMFRGRERSIAIGHWTAWSSIAVIAAPFVGGAILAVASWRWIFLINVPLIAICSLLARATVDESKSSRTRRIDWLGVGLIATGLALLTYGLIEGPVQAWSPASFTAPAIAIAAVVFVAFLWWESRSRDPLVPLRLFGSRTFSGANAMTFLMYGSLGGFGFALVLYLQEQLGYSPVVAGLTLLPISIGLMLFSSKIGALAAQHGARFFMTAGPIISGVGIALLYSLQPGANYWAEVLPATLIFSLGMVLLVAPLTSVVMSAGNEHDSGIVSGINNAVARAAGLIVVAMLGLMGHGVASYHFAIVLCAILAIGGGVVSFFTIKNSPAETK